MSTSDESEKSAELSTVEPAEANIELTVAGQRHTLPYEKAFALACGLLENGHTEQASRIFGRLEEFADRGPRAFIMHAFCESAAKHFDACSERLREAFDSDERQIASTIHDAFVSYHVGDRKEGLRSIAELVDQHQELPSLCLLLGNMLHSMANLPLAQRCWSLAVHRDRSSGAVAAVAMQQLRKSQDDSAAAS